MSEQTYYVRMHGRVLGPFVLSRLQAMTQATKVNHSHEISTDGNSWQKAAAFPEIFVAAPEPAPAAQAEPTDNLKLAPAVAVDPAITQQRSDVDPAFLAEEAEKKRKKPPGQVEWYYAVAGETDSEPEGPVTRTEIVERIKAGDLVRSDMVWQSQMNDWARAGTRPEFKAAFDKLMAAVPSVKGKPSNMLDLGRTIKASRQMVLVLCGLLFLASIALLCLFFSFFGEGLAQGESGQVQRAIFALVLCISVIASMVMLYRYSMLGDEFEKNKRVDDLNLAMVWLGRFWMLLGASVFLAVLFLGLVIAEVI